MTFKEFLKIFREQIEPALVISNDIRPEDIDGFTSVSPDFDTLFTSLETGGNYVISLTRDLSKESYDLIKQYTDRHDAVSIFIDGAWKQLAINTKTTQLLCIVEPDTLKDIEQEYPIRQAVGMVFENKE